MRPSSVGPQTRHHPRVAQIPYPAADRVTQRTNSQDVLAEAIITHRIVAPL